MKNCKRCGNQLNNAKVILCEKCVKAMFDGDLNYLKVSDKNDWEIPMTIKEELAKILCERHEINMKTFDLFDYIDEGWTTEEDLYEAIEILIKKRKCKGTCGGRKRG